MGMRLDVMSWYARACSCCVCSFVNMVLRHPISCHTGAVVLWAFYLPHLNAAVQLPPADEIDRLLRDPAVLQ